MKNDHSNTKNNFEFVYSERCMSVGEYKLDYIIGPIKVDVDYDNLCIRISNTSNKWNFLYKNFIHCIMHMLELGGSFILNIKMNNGLLVNIFVININNWLDNNYKDVSYIEINYDLKVINNYISHKIEIVNFSGIGYHEENHNIDYYNLLKSILIRIILIVFVYIFYKYIYILFLVLLLITLLNIYFIFSNPFEGKSIIYLDNTSITYNSNIIDIIYVLLHNLTFKILYRFIKYDLWFNKKYIINISKSIFTVKFFKVIIIYFVFYYILELTFRFIYIIWCILSSSYKDSFYDIFMKSYNFDYNQNKIIIYLNSKWSVNSVLSDFLKKTLNNNNTRLKFKNFTKDISENFYYNKSNIKKIKFTSIKLDKVPKKHWATKKLSNDDLSISYLTSYKNYFDYNNLKHLNYKDKYLNTTPYINKFYHTKESTILNIPIKKIVDIQYNNNIYIDRNDLLWACIEDGYNPNLITKDFENDIKNIKESIEYIEFAIDKYDLNLENVDKQKLIKYVIKSSNNDLCQIFESIDN